MAGKVRNLVNRNGRYYGAARRAGTASALCRQDGTARPARRRSSNRHRSSPGRYRRHAAPACHRRTAAAARHRRAASKSSYPMTTPQMARQAFDSLADLDLEARRTDARYVATADPDPDEARLYRDGYAGKLTDDELDDLVGHRIERYRFRGNTDATKGTPQWREVSDGPLRLDLRIHGAPARAQRGQLR